MFKEQSLEKDSHLFLNYIIPSFQVLIAYKALAKFQQMNIPGQQKGKKQKECGLIIFLSSSFFSCSNISEKKWVPLFWIKKVNELVDGLEWLHMQDSGVNICKAPWGIRK